MIAKAKAAAKKDKAGPGVSVLHQVTSLPPRVYRNPRRAACMRPAPDAVELLALGASSGVSAALPVLGIEGVAALRWHDS